MTTQEAETVYAEICQLWPKSPRTPFLDAKRMERLENLRVMNADGYSGADRCCMSVVAYYEEQMSESKTPRSTVPFDALMRRLRDLDPKGAPLPEVVDTETGEVSAPLPDLIRWYDLAAERADERAKSAPSDGRVGDPKFYRTMAGVCRRRAQKCRERLEGM